MKFYNRRNIINGSFILILYIIIGSLFVNQKGAEMRYSQATTVARGTQTAISSMTKNAGTEIAVNNLTETVPVIDATPNLPPPCEQKLKRGVELFREPSNSHTIGKINVASGQQIFIFGKLLDEPWWLASRTPSQPEGWLQDIEITIECNRPEKELSLWEGLDMIHYDSFRGVYLWNNGVTEISPAQELVFRYSNNKNNLAEFESLINVNKVNFQIRTQFKIPDRERINQLGLTPKDGFVVIRLRDESNKTIDFKMHLDCRYSSSELNRPIIMKESCEDQIDYFLLLTVEQDVVSGFLNNEEILPFSTPQNFNPRAFYLSIGAFPEASFLYVDVSSQ